MLNTIASLKPLSWPTNVLAAGPRWNATQVFFVFAISSATGNPVDLGSRFALECVAGILESVSIQVFAPMYANVRFCFLVVDHVAALMLLSDDCCVK
jgi:hypothetical protein